MKYKGYTGNILNVNLTEGRIETIPFPEKLAEDYIGGGGAAAKLISDSLDTISSPLDEKNPLIFMTGPLTGTIVPWSGRHCVATISPLTGLWGESYAGGTWGKELKRAGFDGIVISGKSEKLVYLRITDSSVTIENAAHLKGKDSWETDSIIKKEAGEKTKVAAIGAAGENLVRFASVVHDGPASRIAARCGVGAVMGSKNLKAIAVSGEKRVEVANSDALMKSIKEKLPALIINDTEHRVEKAKFVFSNFVADGRHGVNNWRDGELAGFEEALLKEAELHVRHTKPYLCSGCRTGCVESNVKDGIRQSVWESFAPLGSQCGVTDMKHIQKAYDICNQQGIDSISAGGIISFAMECFEEGIITEKDTDGINLRFGNGRGMIEMLKKLCQREGFGNILAEGTKRAASLIGRGAEKLAIEVKGLEVPAHDPRTHNFLALTYATDNRGASHLSASNPHIDGSDLVNLLDVRFTAEGTADMVVRRQNYSNILNSLVLCIFAQAGYAQYYSPTSFGGITAKEVTEWFNLVTGADASFESLMSCGERMFNLKHEINTKLGLTPDLDTLPERLLTLKRGQGPAADHLPQMKEMIEEYYRIRGWGASGNMRRMEK
ncbi:MAG: aldehyde ferredoxin oxidoreductase family protein [Candidatus Schekmanbacteria bacterium]|nr:aldehyde ferredoxin oxidoreductase family protein [Candidatus Schekmanbacteria bacterium]